MIWGNAISKSERQQSAPRISVILKRHRSYVDGTPLPIKSFRVKHVQEKGDLGHL